MPMEILKPDHPPQSGSSSGSGAQMPLTPPASTTPPTGGQGGQQDGKVTITAEEYRNLQRDHARVLSFEKRKEFHRSRNNPPAQPANGEGEGDPELLDRIQKEQEARIEADTRAMKAEVTLKVRDLLDKEEFKALPQSTRALILKNPAMLSDADNADEAMLDIEDFIREQVTALPPANSQPVVPGGSQPPGHETPNRVGSGAPVATDTGGLEDVSKLTGPARSRAALRNAIKKARLGK